MARPEKPVSLIGVSMIRLGPNFFSRPLADFVGAVVLGHFLAHEHDAIVALHFFGEGLVEGFAVGQGGHENSPLIEKFS